MTVALMDSKLECEAARMLSYSTAASVNMNDHVQLKILIELPELP